MDAPAQHPNPDTHVTRVNGRVRLVDRSFAELSVASVLRLEATNGAANEPAGTGADLNESLLTFGVALANALAEAGSPPARLQIDATVWASSVARGSPVARTELHISVQAAGLGESTLEETAWRIARGGEDRQGLFGSSQISLTAAVAEPPRPRRDRMVDVPRDSASRAPSPKTNAANASAMAEAHSTLATSEPAQPAGGGPDAAGSLRPAAASITSPSGRMQRLRRLWILWLTLAAVLLALAYIAVRAQ